MDCERGGARLRSGAVLSLPISRAAVFVLVLVVLIWRRRGIFGKPFYAEI